MFYRYSAITYYRFNHNLHLQIKLEQISSALRLSHPFLRSALTNPLSWSQTSRRQRQAYRFARQYLAWDVGQREEYFKRHSVEIGGGLQEKGDESDSEEEDCQEENEEEEDEDDDDDDEDEIDTLAVSNRVLKTLKNEKLTLKGLSEGLDISRNVLSSLLR